MSIPKVRLSQASRSINATCRSIYSFSFEKNRILLRFERSLYPSNCSWKKGLCSNTNNAQPQIHKQDESSSLLEKLERQFYLTMHKEGVPLLSNFTTYLDSLPVRHIRDKYIRLYSLPFYAHKEDLTAMARQLLDMNTTGTSRFSVKYLCAPSGSGKTASILPAFLESCTMEKGFTHYLYIACDNNKNRNFKVWPSYPNSDKDMAVNQGAAFMFECIKVAVETPNNPGSFIIPLNANPPHNSVTQSNLSEYLLDKFGPDSKILIHIDEHRKMCNRQTDSITKDPGAMFSRGAMEVLAMTTSPKVSVVATYLDPPPISPMGSSTVCRYPIPVPCLDIDQVMHNIEELRVPYSNSFTEADFRRWMTLRICLLRKILQLGVISVIHGLGGNRVEAAVFKAKFNDVNNIAEFTFAEKCRERSILCQVPGSAIFDVINAAKYLLGIPENLISQLDRQIWDIALVEKGLYSPSLFSLLNLHDVDVPVYTSGRVLFEKVLYSLKVINSADYLSNTPLEAMYIWALACKSAVSGSLTFFKTAVFTIKCVDIKPGRLFPDKNSSVYFLPFALKPDIIYYVEEGKGFVSHPLCDIFFRTLKNELVIINITAANDTIVELKEAKLAEWIKNEQPRINMTLRGLILAPLAKGDSTDDSKSGVTVVRGSDARLLLGGLNQFFRWLAVRV